MGKLKILLRADGRRNMSSGTANVLREPARSSVRMDDGTWICKCKWHRTALYFGEHLYWHWYQGRIGAAGTTGRSNQLIHCPLIYPSAATICNTYIYILPIHYIHCCLSLGGLQALVPLVLRTVRLFSNHFILDSSICSRLKVVWL